LKKKIPTSRVVAGHPDFKTLSAIAVEIERRAGGHDRLAADIPEVLRECIDYMINTPRTGRRDFNQLEQEEKVFIAKQVEIVIRKNLKLKKGALDTVILGRDVDIKFTVGTNWMIPPEALGHPCLLIAADEGTGLCYIGLFVARSQFLHKGRGNRDSKRGINAAGFAQIFWILLQHPYPQNFWRSVDAKVVERIFAGRSGNDRMVTLFSGIQERPVPRDVMYAVARQLDFTRRSRSDRTKGNLGTRDRLLRDAIIVLSGANKRKAIAALGLPFCKKTEWISYKPRSAAEWRKAAEFGFKREA
jgi:hypothetical protein